MNNEQIKGGEKKPDLILSIEELSSDPEAVQKKLQQEGLYQVGTLRTLYQQALDLNSPEIAKKIDSLTKTSEKKLKTFNQDMAAAGVQFVQEEITKSAPAKVENKKVISPEEKKAQSRLRELGDLALSLIEEDKKLEAVLKNLKPDNITKVQEDSIDALDKSLRTQFAKHNLNTEEMTDVIKLLANFKTGQKALLQFRIDRAEKAAESLAKAYENDKVTWGKKKYGVREIKLEEPARLKDLKEKAAKYKEELEKLELAA